MSPVLVLDLDGVLYRWHHAVYDYFLVHRDYKGSFDTLWSKDYLNFSKEDWEYLVNVDIFYSSQFPTDDCMNFLDKVKYRFDIYYLTGRPIYVKTTTEQFLRKYRFPFRDNLIFESDKINTARRLRADYCVDDLPENLEILSKVSKVVMVAQPYNKEYRNIYPTAYNLMGVLPFLETREDVLIRELGY
jgi:uncharacterized HAD superfamily protein